MKKSVKQFLAFAVLMTLVLALFTGCKNSEKTENLPAETSVKLWWAYNTENLMQDVEYLELIEQRDHTLQMQCIRGDVESVQLMLTPSVDVSTFDFQMGDLKNTDGDVLKAECFDIFAQWYTEITQSYNTKAYYGFYPDALIPLKNYQDKGYGAIEAGQNQAIWVIANIPTEQNAGVYTGSGELLVDGVTYQVPFEVTIYNAVMPEENHVKTLFAIWFDLVDDGEGEYSKELGEAYYDFLVSKRIMPTKAEDSIWSVHNIDGFVEWAAEQAADPKISCYSLPYSASIVDGEEIVSVEYVIEILSSLAKKNIQLRQDGDTQIDLFQKAAFYLGSICDEPSGARMQKARNCDLVITKSKREVADKYFKDQFPDLYDSCMKVPHIVTTGYNAQMVGSDTVGGVQTWCGQFQTWHSEEQRQTYYDRRDNSERECGEGLWWYGCESPRYPFPSFHMDDDGIVTRIIPWMMFEYDVEGMLYWCVNYYQTEDIYTYPSVFLDTVGDGQLLYPGAKFDVFGPLSSRRLESIREGLEDYEYLLMIENAIVAYNKANGTEHDPKVLMDKMYTGLYEGMIPERDNSEFFAQRRMEILKLLEQFGNDPAGAIETLINR